MTNPMLLNLSFNIQLDVFYSKIYLGIYENALLYILANCNKVQTKPYVMICSAFSKVI